MQHLAIALGDAQAEPAGAEVTLESGADKAYALLRVSHCGPAIDGPARARLFERSYRIPAPDIAGEGLGLSIAKRYCEMLHGTLSVASRLGEGTEFTVELPAVWPTPAADA